MQRKSGFRAPTRRLAGLLAITVLVLMLALGGCAGRGAQRDNGAPGGATTTQQQTTGTSQGSQGGGSNGSADQVESLDQQVQDISSSMNGASQDADSDYSSQDNEVQP
jgi:hypothetical protein